MTERRECDRCSCLENPSAIADGSLDSDRIGPYSRWQGNLDAPLMVVAQDFAGMKGFIEHGGWPGAKVQTNLRLVKRLTEIGIPINPPVRGKSDDRLFFTNAVLCIKPGKMRDPVPQSCYANCGRLFLRKQIEIVSPRVVVTLGWGAAVAVCSAFDLDSPAQLADPSADVIQLTPAIALMPLFHPMASRSTEAHQADWGRVREVLNRCA